jgi:hypothetical protein
LTGLTPRELLELDEAELVRRGVDTVGARNKLLVVSLHPLRMCIWYDEMWLTFHVGWL